MKALGRCSCLCDSTFTFGYNTNKTGCNYLGCFELTGRLCSGNITPSTYLNWEGTWSLDPSKNKNCGVQCCLTGNLILKDVQVLSNWRYTGKSKPDIELNAGCSKFDELEIEFYQSILSPTSHKLIYFGKDHVERWIWTYDLSTGLVNAEYSGYSNNAIQQWRCIDGPCLTNPNANGANQPTSTSHADKLALALRFIGITLISHAILNSF